MRGFGESEGGRGRHRPLEQTQDVYDAFTYLETVDGVDRERLGLYGTSWGGASAIWCAACRRAPVAIRGRPFWSSAARAK